MKRFSAGDFPMTNQTKLLTSIAIIPVWENKEIIDVLNKFELDFVSEVVVVADEPTPEFLKEIEDNCGVIKPKLTILKNSKRMGIGNAIRMGLEHGKANNYDIAVVMAGNGKDNPKEIPKFTKKIEEGYHYIQGSRFLKGGSFEGLPFVRKIIVRMWPIFWSIITWRKQTEVTNGFRCYRLSILDDPKINLYQEWLNGYALEYYIHYRALTNKKCSCTEIPVTKIYQEKKNYTKIRPYKDWPQIALPPILLFLRIRK